MTCPEQHFQIVKFFIQLILKRDIQVSGLGTVGILIPAVPRPANQRAAGVSAPTFFTTERVPLCAGLQENSGFVPAAPPGHSRAAGEYPLAHHFIKQNIAPATGRFERGADIAPQF
ncbi:hypothetical protein CQW29_20475 [Pantoea coffeiphila]|uniref:Uncharacterized protein n=1 Tax=Pantoea coffeiphila TaxID=1465635 RepID=A0A2S9I749_9GAMM|nr:hypothetical protein CQW29_20475 [Pantoea coffeiphila]